MARQPKTAQPKTKFFKKHKMKCKACGNETVTYKLVVVGGKAMAFCDPRHLPNN